MVLRSSWLVLGEEAGVEMQPFSLLGATAYVLE